MTIAGFGGLGRRLYRTGMLVHGLQRISTRSARNAEHLLLHQPLLNVPKSAAEVYAQHRFNPLAGAARWIGKRKGAALALKLSELRRVAAGAGSAAA